MRAHIGLLDDPPGLAEDGGGDEDLLADHGVVLVVGVVGVAELAVGAELELEELVPELALVPHVVPQVELRITAARCHCRRHDSFRPVSNKSLTYKSKSEKMIYFVKQPQL